MNFVVNASVEEITQYSSNLKEYLMKLDKNRKYPPGSFVQLTLDNVTASDRWPESRTFSIASYKKGYMKFIVKREGKYTSKILDNLVCGSSVTLKFPFGDLYDESSDEDQHVFIAGGVGITPFLGLVEYFDSIGMCDNVELHYSAKTYNDLLHIDYLKEKIKNLYIYLTKEEKSGFINRRIMLKDILNGDKAYSKHFYICGSKEFNDDFYNLLSNQGIKNIHMDEWE